MDTPQQPEAIELPRSLIERSLSQWLIGMQQVISLVKLTTLGDGLHPRLRETLKVLHIQGWATLYLDPKNAQIVRILAGMSASEFLEWNHRFSAIHPSEVTKLVTDMLRPLTDDIAHLHDTDVDEDQAWWPSQAEFDAMEESQRQAFEHNLRQRLPFVLVTLYDHLSWFTHRKSIYQLVGEAISGDDDALLKAIQIDKSTLTTIPYFIERNRRAADERDINFQRQIHTHSNKPILHSRMKYPLLGMLIGMLDEMGILDDFESDPERLLTFCEGRGVYGNTNEAADLESFKKRLREFHQSHRRHSPLPLLRIVVKDDTLTRLRP
jgi:hypothetical protein